MKKFEIESKIRNLKTYIKETIYYANLDELTWEEKKIIDYLSNLEDKLCDAEHYIKYYSKETKKGNLYQQADGRYAIDEYTYFTSGSPIEMYLYDPYEEKNIWCEGRVESRYTDNGSVYYFLNSDGENKDLEEGDLVRVRY